MTEQSAIEKKIKEAIKEFNNTQFSPENYDKKPEEIAEEISHRKAKELWVSDEEINEKEDSRSVDEVLTYPIFRGGAKWLRDRLFNAKNDTP